MGVLPVPEGNAKKVKMTVTEQGFAFLSHQYCK
jgi:hypothetical protein